MELSQEERGGVDILTLRGSVRSEDNDAFEACLTELREARRLRLVIDASDLEYVNSRAISEVLRLLQEARLRGGNVVFVRPGQTVQKIMKAVGLYSLVQIYDTLEEAVAACGT